MLFQKDIDHFPASQTLSSLTMGLKLANSNASSSPKKFSMLLSSSPSSWPCTLAEPGWSCELAEPGRVWPVGAVAYSPQNGEMARQRETALKMTAMNCYHPHFSLAGKTSSFPPCLSPVHLPHDHSNLQIINSLASLSSNSSEIHFSRSKHSFSLWTSVESELPWDAITRATNHMQQKKSGYWCARVTGTGYWTLFCCIVLCI